MKIAANYAYDNNGNLFITDDRDFYDCQNFQIKFIKKMAMEKIISMAPEYKQRNAALGLLSNEETQQIKNDIQNIRQISNNLEQQILAITWDGTEETRTTACDAVQNIRWP